MEASDQQPSTSSESSDTRSLYDIVWSCLVVVFACTWIAVHPNVPPPHIRKSRWLMFRRRVLLMLWALLVPEFMVMWATWQWSMAGLASEEYGNQLKGTDEQCTRTHGFFLIMGGFSVFKRDKAATRGNFVVAPMNDVKHNIDAELQPPTPMAASPPLRCPSTSTNRHPDVEEVRLHLQYLKGSHRLACPSISEDEIKDKSKGDALAKALVILQTTWFTLQILFRFAEHMVVTELEIVTLAYAVLGAMMYGFWWNKPRDVELPVPVYPPEETEIRGLNSQKLFYALHSRVGELIQGVTILRFHAKVVDEPAGVFLPFMFEPTAHEKRTVVISAFAGTVFGAMHCIAWTFDFPTTSERLFVVDRVRPGNRHPTRVGGNGLDD